MDPREREIDRLEEDLQRDDLTEKERKEIRRDIRDLSADMYEEDQWREEGYGRGWA